MWPQEIHISKNTKYKFGFRKYLWNFNGNELDQYFYEINLGPVVIYWVYY